VHLHQQGYATNTIRTFTAAISYHHKIRQLPDPALSFIITKAFQGLHRINPPTEAREPVTLDLLHSMLHLVHTHATGPYEIRLFQAMLLSAFFALCRISELTHGKTGHNLYRSDIQLLHTGQQYVITFRTFKHSVAKQSVTVSSQPMYCPVAAMHAYCALRPPNAIYLFCLPDGRPVSRILFVNMLKRLVLASHKDPQLFTTHSLRIGGATYAAQLGMSPLQIQRLGRWHSNAFFRYLRW
jgi:hypothetical protein